jgi:signal transduction histidine kinase
MPYLNFTIDSALLRELGERLVGKPHIALAELVKNGYDADAHTVTIRFLPDQDRIEVQDNGHGMDFDDFRDFWMRIGTPHKDQKRVSKYLERPMTGSKGVGRLSVQFLAGELTLRTVPKEADGEWLEAYVNWAEAVQAGDLTNATVRYTMKRSSPPFEQGTSVILRGLKHQWGATSIRELARELWWLQPPFRSSSVRDDPKDVFAIHFDSSERRFEKIFDTQMRAILGIWTARLVGKNRKGKAELSLEFAGEAPQVYTYSIADFPHNKGYYNKKSNLNDGSFEIRIFKLQYRQPHGIKVGDAREFFEKYGGVQVYDSGFRLPYYGYSTNDWLKIEVDHSHRIFVSELLPEEFQAKYAHTQRLRYLPTLERLFGVVNVNTSREPGLEIMITRDRLAESVAFEDLQSMVRYALDLYAMEEARRQYERFQTWTPIEPAPRKLERVERALEYYQPQIPPEVFRDIQTTVREATVAVTTSQERVLEEVGLLGALATAGISAVAYQHELRKQFSVIESIIDRIKRTKTENQKLREYLDSLGEDLSAWLERAKATNALFDYLADAENTQTKYRFRAAVVIKDIKRQTRFLARGIAVNIDHIDPKLRLPKASLAEWGAIFQNLFTNAFTAMLDSEEQLLQVSSRINGRQREILIQDTGYGVDLKNADRLFQPFERASKISQARQALGYGGTGLGLTIVRLLADRIGCRVGFIEPEQGFSTAFSISWRETR